MVRRWSTSSDASSAPPWSRHTATSGQAHSAMLRDVVTPLRRSRHSPARCHTAPSRRTRFTGLATTKREYWASVGIHALPVTSASDIDDQAPNRQRRTPLLVASGGVALNLCPMGPALTCLYLFFYVFTVFCGTCAGRLAALESSEFWRLFCRRVLRGSRVASRWVNSQPGRPSLTP